jgi:hypothetical protein
MAPKNVTILDLLCAPFFVLMLPFPHSHFLPNVTLFAHFKASVCRHDRYQGFPKIQCSMGIFQKDGQEGSKQRKFQMLTQFRLNRFGKEGRSVLAPFSVPYVDNVAVEIKVLNPKPDTFHQAHARPIKYLGHKKVGAFNVGHHALSFGLGHHDGRPNTFFSSDRFYLILNWLVEHMAVQTQIGGKFSMFGAQYANRWKKIDSLMVCFHNSKIAGPSFPCLGL